MKPRKWMTYTVLLFVIAVTLMGCMGNMVTPTGQTIGYTSTEPIINIKMGENEIHFQGDTILAEEDMMYRVMDKMQHIHDRNSQLPKAIKP